MLEDYMDRTIIPPGSKKKKKNSPDSYFPLLFVTLLNILKKKRKFSFILKYFNIAVL